MAGMIQDISMPQWRTRLDESQTEAEILAVVRRFLLAVPPEDLARLPGECRHISIDNVPSVSQWAVTVRRHELSAVTQRAEYGLLRSLSELLGFAAIRLATIASSRRARSHEGT